MSIVMSMKWDGVTPEQYDAVRDAVRWETEAPAGGEFHVAWFEGSTMRVVDVWSSAEEFDTFVNDRLMPGVAQVGIEGQPEVEIQPAHRVYDSSTGVSHS